MYNSLNFLKGGLVGIFTKTLSLRGDENLLFLVVLSIFFFKYQIYIKIQTYQPKSNPQALDFGKYVENCSSHKQKCSQPHEMTKLPLRDLSHVRYICRERDLSYVDANVS